MYRIAARCSVGTGAILWIATCTLKLGHVLDSQPHVQTLVIR